MKQIILLIATALFGSAGLMAQDASAVLRATSDFSALHSAIPDSSIHYDTNDKKSTKEINVFNENNFHIQTDIFIWDEATAGWKPDGKTVHTPDSKGRSTLNIHYSAAGAEESKEEMSYEGDHFYPKTVTSFTKEGGSWVSEATITYTKIEVDAIGRSTLLEGTTEVDGMSITIKTATTYEGDITYIKNDIMMGGAIFQTSEAKNELVDKSNPYITKNYTKENGAWKYTGMDYDYFSDRKPDNPNSNETITAEKIEWRLNGTILEVPAAGNGIKIYAITGHLVQESRTSAIDVSTLSPGVYIVKTDKGSFKISF